MIEWFKEKRRKRKLRRGFEVWKYYFYNCKDCSGLGEVEMFTDPAYRLLQRTECYSCNGTGIRQDASNIPDKYKELL